MTIPWVSQPNSAVLSFNFTSTGSEDDFGIDNVSIGGGSCGLQLWVKGDGILTKDTSGNVTNWNDESYFNRDFNTATSDPQWTDGGLNFNPTVNFDGNDYISITGANATFSTAWSEGEVFSVVRSNAGAGTYGMPFYFGGSANGWYTYANTIYNDFGTSLRKAWKR